MKSEAVFSIIARDGKARRATVYTQHGTFETPAFMPVGTLATVKGLTPKQINSTGTQILLANAYHLALRPGERIVKELGGLHKFMNWDKPILTDSGGYQVFSLSSTRTVTDEGVRFRSHLDGSEVYITPERATRIQDDLGADIIMAFDECPPPVAPQNVVKTAVDRTLRWAAQCKQEHGDRKSLLFGIVQGGAYEALRRDCAKALSDIGFPGYGIGGLGIGEGADAMIEAVAATLESLPDDSPRYLMGLGRPNDIVRAIGLGVDMFDCVIPTRNARNAMLFTDEGPLRMRNASFATDPLPVSETCNCYTCANFSRAYIRHLYMSSEMLAGVLGSIHNISYYQNLVRRCRDAISAGRYSAFESDFVERYSTQPED